ncbi:hypothetical protein HK097_006979 [Rhizophlyctis rosea]|uniref:Uncharacterized protein n=1 Tax=Rhizophlyctis rosea TaxID=64517 RepID=A0AAD5SC97_9FUNG|nr:hypothetical protein HK097_006979 [Rhizophlyctis rosea]
MTPRTPSFLLLSLLLSLLISFHPTTTLANPSLLTTNEPLYPRDPSPHFGSSNGRKENDTPERQGREENDTPERQGRGAGRGHCKKTFAFGGSRLDTKKIVKIVVKAGFKDLRKCTVAVALAKCGSKGYAGAVWVDDTCTRHKGLLSLAYPSLRSPNIRPNTSPTCALNPTCAAQKLYTQITRKGHTWKAFEDLFEGCGAARSVVRGLSGRAVRVGPRHFGQEKKQGEMKGGDGEMDARKALRKLEMGSRRWQGIVREAWRECQANLPTPTTPSCGNGFVGSGVCEDESECCSDSGWCGKRFCTPGAEPS